MSRSLGDTYAASLGCVCLPEIKKNLLNLKTDRAIVLASDGVWDVLSNHEVAKIVQKNIKEGLQDETASAITQLAKSKWHSLFKDGHFDDITCVVVFLK